MPADVGTVLTHILVVLVAAKLAAELAERIGVPPVVGEIVAGILIGPSLLGLVGQDEVLRTLGEIGAILLLLEVGLEMDLGELGKVGRASLLVATVGVVSPLVLGLGAMQLLGADFNTSLFVAAALTATSVGITARVFGDLKALATPEARIVLGAAVADDVMGLVVLTVVVRLVTEGSVSVVSVAGIVAAAGAFLVVGGLLSLRLAPPLFAAVERLSRSTGTLVALALAFTLGFAELAHAARLAPIVGAFVAGLALARSRQADRIRRELAPVGHLFIPVFFLQIGIDAQVSAFGRAAVLRDAAVLLAVAVVGKLVSPIGAGTRTDKMLIGLGMLPRGEVGLIFATLGLRTGVLDDDLYAALLLVVLVTTIGSPQLLRWRYQRLRSGRRTAVSAGGADTEPDGGWLDVRGGDVRLLARPPTHLVLPLALEAAALMAEARPSAELLDWFSESADAPMPWSPRATTGFLGVLTRGNGRSWRFLDTLGILERALPELAEALRARQADPFELDPTRLHRWTTIEHLLERTTSGPLAQEWARLGHPERVILAGLLVEALEGRDDRVAVARRLVGRLGLGAAAEQEVARLVADADLLRSMAARPDGLREEPVLQLAAHLSTAETARAAYLLAAARIEEGDRMAPPQLASLYDLVMRALDDPTLTGRDARNLVAGRRAEVSRLVGDDQRALERVGSAPRAYLLAEPAEAIARQVALLGLAGDDPHVRIATAPGPDGLGWRLDVAARDPGGLLATVAGALATAGLDVGRAVVATWPDRTVVASFIVTGVRSPDPTVLGEAIEVGLRSPRASAPVPGAIIGFDDGTSPWHTAVEVRAPDRPGLLHSIATALEAAGVVVHTARIESRDGEAVDRFAITDAHGAKLDEPARAAVTTFLATGVAPRRRWRRPRRVSGPVAPVQEQVRQPSSRANDPHTRVKF